MRAKLSQEHIPEHLQKTFLLAAMILGIVIKCMLLYFYALVDGDKGLQAVAAFNIAYGNGYTIPEYNLLTHQVNNIPLLEWPPLYSFLLVPFLFLTGFSMEWSCFLLDACAGISLLIFLTLLLRKIGFPVWLQALLILFKSAELNATALISFPTDTWATAAVIAALYFLLRAVERPAIGTIILFALINVLPFYFRYMYLPVVFVMPFLYTWQHFQSVPSRRYVYIIWSITLVAVTGLLFYNWMVSREVVFMITRERGFYPETFLAMAPVFWASFINVDFYCMQVSLHTSLSYKNFQDVLKATSAILLLLMITQFARHLKSYFRRTTPINNFFLYGGGLSLSIFLVIIMLSLTNSPYSPYNKTDFWTYVMEERYFAVPSLVIMIAACWWMFVRDIRFPLLQKFCRFLFLLIVAIEVSHAVYLIFKKSNEDPQHYSVYIYAKEQRKILLKDILSEERKKGTDIILVSDQYGYIMQGFLEGIKVSRNMAVLEKDLTFTKPTTVLFALPSERANHLNSVIRKHNFELIPASENYYLYKTTFLPQ